MAPTSLRVKAQVVSSAQTLCLPSLSPPPLCPPLTLSLAHSILATLGSLLVTEHMAHSSPRAFAPSPQSAKLLAHMCLWFPPSGPAFSENSPNRAVSAAPPSLPTPALHLFIPSSPPKHGICDYGLSTRCHVVLPTNIFSAARIWL